MKVEVEMKLVVDVVHVIVVVVMVIQMMGCKSTPVIIAEIPDNNCLHDHRR
jgi:hypothetical protein